MNATESPILNATGTVSIRVTRLSDWGSFFAEVKKLNGAPLMRTGECKNPRIAQAEAEEYCRDNHATVHHYSTRDI